MTGTEHYTAWEGYWQDTSDTEGEAIWDADPSLTAAVHLALLEPHMDPALPIVDVGCGNGTQTRYLATRFAHTVGVDISHAAVEHARRADTKGSAAFEQLDLTDTDRVRALAARLGDSNVYLRAVIHQSPPENRAPVAEAVAHLLGRRGRGFVVELTNAAKGVLQELAQRPEGPSEKFQRVVAHGLRPADTADGEVAALLRGAGLEILAEGAVALAMTEFHPDGRRVELPAVWFVVGHPTGRPTAQPAG
ncbi:class I SAM-dependent methyltransferase [Streptomyces gamaensis]|uniref:Class I SAM-dependent methyltransferase n=1 Tax=Streptomyces gamaensis TaxID=1763542 RepID=A0ABW0YS02_9ACTN